MCVFCRIANGQERARIIRQDDDLVAFADVHPQAPTHVLIIPRRHLTSLDDARPGDEELLGKLVLTAKQIAEEMGLQGGYRLVINTGPTAGQSVMHVHVHLLGGRRMRWPPG
jgi:histidine triad (HIT) family protein